VLQKITEKLVNDLIDFFQSIPIFSSWSRIFLAKFMHKMERKSCIKYQNIIKEGEPITEIYIIKGGEFEVSSKVEQK
jgi:signal-transduction protein with cAMP-binding, CBS, and nucleotidyltransferase domain